LGQIPDAIIQSIASNIVYSSAVGRSDLSGDDWGDIFAAAVNGTHLNSPLGIADVVLGNTAWSAKTIKAGNPVSTNHVRLISGRNAPVFSFGNDDPFSDVQETGSQVLQIWNARVEEATQQYPQLRTIVLVRNMDDFRFKVFEIPTTQFDPSDYSWSLNVRNNLEGRTVQNKMHTFTWQPHGSQFTIIRQVSGSARSFEVRKPGTLNPQQLLTNLGYSQNWVTFL
jgi:hypothetical protein